MAKSNEPFWWSLFSAGGVIAAFFFPITIAITGIAVPLGLINADSLWALIVHPLGQLYLLTLISLPLFHWAHRFRFVVVDLGLKGMGGVLAVVFYGIAILGSVLAIVFLVRLWFAA